MYQSYLNSFFLKTRMYKILIISPISFKIHLFSSHSIKKPGFVPAVKSKDA